MNALPARTTYVHATDDSTHYLLDTERVGLIDLTLRLPPDPGPHAAVLISYGATGAGFVDATTVAQAFTEAGFATVLFGRDATGPKPPADPLADWQRVLSWAAAHAELRADALAAWGFARDGDDVRRLVATAPPGLRAALAVMPEPEPAGPLRRTVQAVRATRAALLEPPARTPLMIAISILDRRSEVRLRTLARTTPRVQWARYRAPAGETFYRAGLAPMLTDQLEFLRRHLGR